MQSENEVLTVEEARHILRLGRSACYEAVRRGDLPAIHIGRRILIPSRALYRLLSEGQCGGRRNNLHPQGR
jgi:excisionase family DNA binding protein